MSVTIGKDNEAVVIDNSANGIQFRGPTQDNGQYLYCVVPATEWYTAWDKLKTVRNGDVHQWSYLDEHRRSMVLIESYVEHVKNVHRVQIAVKVVPLKYSKEFKDLKTFSENRT